MRTDAVPTRSEAIASVWRVGRGLLWVAGLALAYVLVARIVLTIWVLATRPQEYAPSFNTLLPDAGTSSGNVFAQVPVMIASGLEALAHRGRWGGQYLPDGRDHPRGRIPDHARRVGRHLWKLQRRLRHIQVFRGGGENFKLM